MSQTQLICFRVAVSEKARINAAAVLQGKSISSFVKDVVIRNVEKTEARPTTKPKQCTGIPAYFRAFCAEAERGGSFGFRAVGYQFAGHLAGEIPPTKLLDEWQIELNALAELFAEVRAYEPHALILRQEIVTPVWNWFEQHFPNHMKLVSKRRRDQFILGVFEAAADETISLTT